MIGTSIKDYLFISFWIIILHWIAPLCVLYSISSLFFAPPFYVPRILQIWAILETAFYFLIYHPRRIYLQRAATHPPTISREDRAQLFQRCQENIPDPERYLAKWFKDAPKEEIRWENVKDFFRWAFLNTGEVDREYDEELEGWVKETETLLQRKIEPGRGNAQCLRLTLDKVEMLHRSLTWYGCVFFVDFLASCHLKYHHFHFHSNNLLQLPRVFPLRPFALFTPHRSPAKTLTYWHRPHTSKTRLPVLFIHGIGIGLYPYINFLAELNAENEASDSDGEVGIIAVEIMSISFRITAEAMEKEETCREIDSIVKAHGWDKFVLVSHSYGSVIATHLLHRAELAPKIGPILFIDPVSFLLHLPDVAYNFICRKPIRANEHQLHYFASKDMGVSHTLFRRFFWSENILWKEDIGDRRVTVVLGGKDLIVDTETVRSYLTGGGKEGDLTADGKKVGWTGGEGGKGWEERGKGGEGGQNGKQGWKEEGLWKGNGLDVLWYPQLDHAQVFDKKRTRKQLVDVTRRYCQK